MTSPETPKLAAMLPAEKRAISVIASIATLRMFGLFALLPVLSLYAARLDGATPLLIGLAVGAYGLTQAALQIPLGALSDRIGRMPVIVGGLIVFGAGSLLAAYSESIQGLVAGRLLQGAGAISATLAALIADATRESVRTRAMAVYGVGIGGSFLLAMIAGPVLAGSFGVPALFVFAAALAVFAMLLLAAMPQGIERPSTPRAGGFRSALRFDLLRLDLYVFVLHAILTASFVALPFLLADRLEIVAAEQWKLYVGSIVLSLAGAVPLIVLDDRRGKTSTMRIGVLLILAGELALAFGGVSVWPVFIALTLFFAGFNFLEAALPARLSLLASGGVRGASLGVFSSAQFLGVFAGGLLGGHFLAGGRPQDVFLICAVLAGIWLVFHGLGDSRD